MLSQGNRKGFEIFIQSEEGENRLKEYKVQHAKGKFPTSQCFVEVIPAPFSIHAIKHDDLNITESDWRCVYHIDGQYIAEYALLRESDSNCVDEIYEEEDGELYGRNLQFIPAKTTDEPKNIHAGSKNLDHIGNIQITIFRGVYKEVSVDLYDESKIETCTLDEKQGKMAYTVGATERHLVEVPEVPSFTWTPSKAKNVNFYRFIFKYRTHVELVKLGLKEEPVSNHSMKYAENENPISRKRKNDIIMSKHSIKYTKNENTISCKRKSDIIKSNEEDADISMKYCDSHEG